MFLGNILSFFGGQNFRCELELGPLADNHHIGTVYLPRYGIRRRSDDVFREFIAKIGHLVSIATFSWRLKQDVAGARSKLQS